MLILAVLAAGLTLALAQSAPAQPGRMHAEKSRGAATVAEGWCRRHRIALSLVAGAGAAGFAGGVWVLPFGILVGGAMWALLGRVESARERTLKGEVTRDLGPLIDILAASMRAGAPPALALDVACTALPGAAADRLAVVRAQLTLGADPEASWLPLIDDDALAPLARALVRAHRVGAPVAGVISRVAEDLVERERSDLEQRARAVGVKAALPLGLCLLPAFLLLGIVPVAAGLLTRLA